MSREPHNKLVRFGVWFTTSIQPFPTRTDVYAAYAFPLSTNGWGTFTVVIDVEGRNGSLTRLLYPLRFS